MIHRPPRGELQLVGRLMDASNATFVAHDEDGVQWVYKPVRGEVPLWDFPTHTLGLREVAAYDWSRGAGFDVVPPTFWVGGPFGEGSAQLWVDEIEPGFVDVVAADEVPEGWFPVVAGLDGSDRPVVLCHADDRSLRQLALFDVLLNNSDRKGGHVLRCAGGVLGADHGVSFHQDPKLRTVLWGWRGSALTKSERALVARAAECAPKVLVALDQVEVAAAVQRCEELLDRGHLPEPTDAWPVIPWPPM